MRPKAEMINKVDWLEFARIAFGYYDIKPSEFWTMTPSDFWLVHDGLRRKQGKVTAKPTPMSQTDLAELKAKIRAKGHKV